MNSGPAGIIESRCCAVPCVKGLGSKPWSNGGTQGLLDGDVDRVELVMSRDLLCQCTAAEIFGHDEVADEIEEPARLEHAGEHDLQRRLP
jgi:hypothetical protein